MGSEMCIRDRSCTWTNAGWNNETLPESGPLHYTSRGESLESNAPRLDDSIFEFIRDKNNNEEYAYIWSLNNEWKCVKMNQFNDNDPEFVEIPEGALTV